MKELIDRITALPRYLRYIVLVLALAVLLLPLLLFVGSAGPSSFVSSVLTG